MFTQVQQIEDINAHSSSEHPAASDEVAVVSDPYMQAESSDDRVNDEEEDSPGLAVAMSGTPDTAETLAREPED